MKRLVQRVLPAQNLPPLIVASIGRSGSTILFDALRDAVAAHRFPGLSQGLAIRLVSDTAWDMARTSFVPGVVYKTHGLPDEIDPQSGARVIFLFDKASDVALSVLSCRERYGDAWIAEHFRHLRAQGQLPELAERDILRFREQIDGWIGKTGLKRLIVHYDALWDNIDVLSEFAGVSLSLPPRRPRKSSDVPDPETRARYVESYAALNSHIATLPRIQVLN